MRCDEISTANLPAERQLDAWQSWYGSVFQADPLEPDASDFVAHHKSWNIAGLSLTWVSAPAISVVRNKTLIRREPIDHWAITVSAGSETRLDAPSGQLVAPPSLPFVATLGQEIYNERDADERIQLYLARDAFFGLSPMLDACCLKSIDSNGGHLEVSTALGTYSFMPDGTLRNTP